MLHNRPGISIFSLLMGVALLFVACESNPVDSGQDVTPDDLEAELSFSTDHIHTLSDVGISVEVKDQQGTAVTDIEAVEVERRLAGETDWQGIELSQEGTHFEGTYTFMTSGDHEVRVTGQLPGDAERSVIDERPAPLGVGRAHVEKSGYRIEFENFPGHAHEGEEVALKFWVLDADSDDPVEGLSAEIHCTDPSGAKEAHDSHEHEAGVYEAHHTLEEAGEGHFAVHFPGSDGEIEADFHVPVASGH